MAIAGIVTHLALRWSSDASPVVKALPLCVVPVGGGVPIVLSDSSVGGAFASVAWLGDGTLVYTHVLTRALMRVGEDGELILEPTEEDEQLAAPSV